MTRSLVSLLAFSVVLAAGCDAPSDGKTDKAETGTETAVDCFDEDADGFCVSDGDCDDSDPVVNPDAEEICDSVDNNCNGQVDEDGETLYYADADGDGFGDRNDSIMACEPGPGYVVSDDDCNDDDVTVYPDAPELCDELDNDCDGDVDEELTTTYYADADGDGYGDPGVVNNTCSTPGEGWVANSDDCNDAEAMAYNGATEVCDGIDNDCNGIVDDDMSSTWYPDADGDGYGDDSAAFDSCIGPGDGYLNTGGDCNDREPLAYTGALEVCDSVDNDCNGFVDDDAIDATAQTADADGDGFGSPTATVYACDPLVDNTLDCDDSDANNPQVVDDGAASSSADGSITNPWTNIQDGIDAATMCVYVESGTYVENIDFSGKDISVFSADGWPSTFIVGTGTGSVVTFDQGEGSGAELDGFTINGGGGTQESVVTTEMDSATVHTTTHTSYYGGGVYVDGASPTLSNLRIAENSLPAYSYTETSSTAVVIVTSYGGGLFSTDGSPTMTGVTFDSNYATYGGGAYVGGTGTSTFDQGSFAENAADNGGGYYLADATFNLTNAILNSNDGGVGAGGAYIAGAGASTWWNVTSAGDSSGVGLDTGAMFDFYSSSISAASNYGVYGDSGSTFMAAYSNVYGSGAGEFFGLVDPTGSNGNISVNPNFTAWSADGDSTNDDLSLAAGSPLINAGNPSAGYDDYDGSINDIGAYGGPGGNW